MSGRRGLHDPSPGGTPRESSREAWGLDGFAIGLALSGGGTPAVWRDELRRAQRADELGLHSLWVPEMHFLRGACSSPIVALFAFAAVTERIRLASTSLLLPIHAPDALARDLAALDRMLAIWQHEAVSPPLAVAAFGPKGLAQAARRGLPYLPSMIETLEQNYAAHAAALPDSAVRAEIVVPVLRTVHVAADGAEARRVLEALRASAGSQARHRALPAHIARAAEAPPEERAIVGTADQVADRLGEYRERIGLDLLVVAGAFGVTSDRDRDASLERLVQEVWPQLRHSARPRR